MPERESAVYEEEKPVPFDPIIPLFREWALLKPELDRLATRRNELRDKVARAVEERGYRDHKGSQYIDLPFPIDAGGVSYARIKRERRVAISPDIERAEEITRARGEGIYARVFPLRPAFDQDELYVLLQEGLISEADMDAIFVQHESYAFKGLAS